MSKILVTGSNGFIGSHLVEKLLAQGHEVIGIDHFSMGKVTNLKEHPNLVVIAGSILDDGIGVLFTDIDYVFHLAALTRPQESIIDPVSTNKVNVEGTLKVLMHCKNSNVKRVVFASTTGLYGDQDILPTPETAIPHPMSPYALSKLIGEQYCKLFEVMYDLQVNYIRPFNVYGSRQNPAGGYAAAVPKFIELLSKGETPWITGDGTQARDFVYVEDVVDLMILMSTCDVYGEAFNAGSGTNTSINDVYSIISKILKVNIAPNYIDPVFEPKQTLGDISKAKQLLGWEPKVNLEKGLRLTIKETLKDA